MFLSDRTGFFNILYTLYINQSFISGLGVSPSDICVYKRIQETGEIKGKTYPIKKHIEPRLLHQEVFRLKKEYIH